MTNRETEHASQDGERPVRLDRRAPINDAVQQRYDVAPADVLGLPAGPARQHVLVQHAPVLGGAALPDRVAGEVGLDEFLDSFGVPLRLAVRDNEGARINAPFEQLFRLGELDASIGERELRIRAEGEASRPAGEMVEPDEALNAARRDSDAEPLARSIPYLVANRTPSECRDRSIGQSYAAVLFLIFIGS